ncbi:RebB family R body protein [Bradyrhizobium genosp. P]|uniref:RebB family R body protein n=1 Tax=Bradyrhizobium genosp. P TaxID=83641 RepID=UPI003CF306B6
MTDTAPPQDSANGELNDQIKDAVEQLNASFRGMGPNVPEAIAYQAMAHAVGLALQNTVLQQQHDHMLRNSLTTAAAAALLEGRREEADAVLKLADERLGGRLNLSEEIARIGEVPKSIGEQFKTH